MASVITNKTPKNNNSKIGKKHKAKWLETFTKLEENMKRTFSSVQHTRKEDKRKEKKTKNKKEQKE